MKPVLPVKNRVTPALAYNSPPTRPANINQWGREGERYQQQQQQQQQQQPVPQQSPFQHRNPAIQVPAMQPQPQFVPGYGVDYNSNNYGYQQQQQPGTNAIKRRFTIL